MTFDWPTPVPVDAEPGTTTVPAGAPVTTSRADLLRSVLIWEQVAKRARTLAAGMRGRLDEQARAELATQGTAPTWRLPDLATVTLPVSRETIVVDDEAALLKWAKERMPDAVETIEQLRPRAVNDLMARAQIAAGGVVCLDDGEIVPGLGVRAGGQPGSLSIRATAEAKAVVEMAATNVLDAVASALGEPVGVEPAP